MKTFFGARYNRFNQHVGCLCHGDAALALTSRLSRGLTRRSMLGGLTALMATSVVVGGADALAQQSGRSLVLDRVRLFDGLSDTLLENRAVLVKDGLVADVLAAGTKVADVDVIDCGNRVLMPGLIDAHWHSLLAGISQMAAMTADIPYVHLVAAKEAQATLLRGFTTVRDVGGPAFALKRAIDEGTISGPRIYPSGAMVSQTSGHGDFRQRTDLPRGSRNDLSLTEIAGIAAIADGEAEVLRRVREQLMLGASQIKIMVGGGVASSFDPLDSLQFTESEIRAAVSAASDWGTYVCAHVYTDAGIRRALDCGVRSIEHGQLAEEETVRRMADLGAWWSLQPFLADEDSNVYPTALQREQQKAIAEGTVRAFDLGQKHGVNMAFGTDILFNPKGTVTQGKQLTKLARWFGNAGVLKIATSTNARLLALSGPRNPYAAPLGLITAGALADLLVIDGNPLEDLSLIADPDKNIKMVIKNGRIYKNTFAA